MDPTGLAQTRAPNPVIHLFTEAEKKERKKERKKPSQSPGPEISYWLTLRSGRCHSFPSLTSYQFTESTHFLAKSLAMADVVQYRLERMVDELDDLERRGLFTRHEISEIVKQRRKFEYRLKRPSPLKQDYLAYIEYESQLDALRRLRKKSIGRDEGRERRVSKKMKKSVSDFSGVARILEIYRLAVMRFKGDIELWFKYMEFCRQRKNGRMKKVIVLFSFFFRMFGWSVFSS